MHFYSQAGRLLLWKNPTSVADNRQRTV